MDDLLNKPVTEEAVDREARNIYIKYPDKIPIIVLASESHAADLPTLDKNKFLVSKDLTTGQFLYIIRKRMKLESHRALFLFTEGRTLPVTHMPLVSVFDEHKNKDGFLYFKYSSENAFGSL